MPLASHPSPAVPARPRCVARAQAACTVDDFSWFSVRLRLRHLGGVAGPETTTSTTGGRSPGRSAQMPCRICLVKGFRTVQPTVNFIYDGLHLTPLEYAQTLYACAETNAIQPDAYSIGGIVEEL